MLPNLMPTAVFQRLSRRNDQTVREAKSLTSYLRFDATPAEKAAYERATRPGTKAGTAPTTPAQLQALAK